MKFLFNNIAVGHEISHMDFTLKLFFTFLPTRTALSTSYFYNCTCGAERVSVLLRLFFEEVVWAWEFGKLPFERLRWTLNYNRINFLIP